MSDQDPVLALDVARLLDLLPAQAALGPCAPAAAAGPLVASARGAGAVD